MEMEIDWGRGGEGMRWDPVKLLLFLLLWGQQPNPNFEQAPKPTNTFISLPPTQQHQTNVVNALQQLPLALYVSAKLTLLLYYFFFF